MPISNFRDRLSCGVTNTPGTAGNFTIGPAQSSFLTFGAADDGLPFKIEVQEGTAWEVRSGCIYTHSTTTLTRGTLEKSSTGGAVSFTTAAVLTNVVSAATFNDLEKQLNRGFVFVQNDGAATQSLSNGYNKIAAALATVVANDLGFWDATNKRFQPTRPGKYLIQFAAAQAHTVPAVLYPAIYKNSALYLNGPQFAGASNVIAGMSATIDVNGTSDYLEFYLYTSLVGATSASAASTWFQATYLGA